MKQLRAMSLVEAKTNVIVGYGVAIATQMLVFPWFGFHMTWAQNLKLAIAFTLISIVRSFALRRLFEAIRASRSERETAGPARRWCQNPPVFRRVFGKFGHARRSFPK